MTNSKFSSLLTFKKTIPAHEVVVKFFSTTPGLGTSNDIVLSVNQKYIDKKSLYKLIIREFNWLSRDHLPKEFCTLKEFTDLELKEQFVDFLAITLAAYQALTKKQKNCCQPGACFTKDGVLSLIVDKKHLELSDYFLAVQMFLNHHRIGLSQTQMYTQFLIPIKDIAHEQNSAESYDF